VDERGIPPTWWITTRVGVSLRIDLGHDEALLVFVEGVVREGDRLLGGGLLHAHVRLLLVLGRKIFFIILLSLLGRERSAARGASRRGLLPVRLGEGRFRAVCATHRRVAAWLRLEGGTLATSRRAPRF